MIIADTSGLLAFFNTAEPAHERVARAVAEADDLLVVSPFVLAELDYLVGTRLGVDAELTLLSELFSGAYDLAGLDTVDHQRCVEIIAKYRDQEVGLTDASLVALAHRHETNRILTLDRRHFDVMKPIAGGHFDLVGA